MTLHRVQAVIQHDSALPEDVATNTWHFAVFTDPAPDATREAIFTALSDFYLAIDQLFNTQYGTRIDLKMYDLDDPMPRPVVDERAVTIAAAGGAGPEELACVLSFQADPAPGVPQRRRRGRVYLPIGVSSIAQTNGRMIIATTARQTIVTAAVGLLTASISATDWSWVIHAPSNPLEVDQAPPVEGGWVDDAWDIQRRRGTKAQTRLIW